MDPKIVALQKTFKQENAALQDAQQGLPNRRCPVAHLIVGCSC